jgi:SAM-dependent methyltransferase
MNASLPGDVIFHRAGPDLWVASNVFVRTHLGLDGAGMAMIDRLAAGERATGIAKAWPLTRFTNEVSLLSDPTRLVRDPAEWGDPELLDATGLLRRGLDQCILVEDAAEYRSRFTRKDSLLDRHHFGNFHEQLGQHLMLNLRKKPGDWWPRQKFTDDFAAIRPGPYRAIEEAYLDRYFPERLTPGWKVIDLGCGTGHFTRKIAAVGCDALGLDPNPDYIAIARGGPATTARFEVAPLGKPGSLDAIAPESADAVFISDALLFYFVSPVGPDPEDIDYLMADIRRVLKPGGRFVNVESHFQFWLQPWLGDEDRPFTVLTEHLDRRFAVTPSYSAYIQAITRSGFAVGWMDEMRPDASLAETTRRGYHFAREFPLWQIFEFIKL